MFTYFCSRWLGLTVLETGVELDGELTHTARVGDLREVDGIVGIVEAGVEAVAVVIGRMEDVLEVSVVAGGQAVDARDDPVGKVVAHEPLLLVAQVASARVLVEGLYGVQIDGVVEHARFGEQRVGVVRRQRVHIAHHDYGKRRGRLREEANLRGHLVAHILLNAVHDEHGARERGAQEDHEPDELERPRRCAEGVRQAVDFDLLELCVEMRCEPIGGCRRSFISRHSTILQNRLYTFKKLK